LLQVVPELQIGGTSKPKISVVLVLTFVCAPTANEGTNVNSTTLREQLPDRRFIINDMAPSDRTGGQMSDSLAAREARLRRVAARQGLAIVKSRRRGEEASYAIVDPQTETVARGGASSDGSLTIEQAEAILGDPQSTKSISIANLNAANDE
jgi:hypothetical protein